MTARAFEGFDVERRVPVCEPCHRAAARLWTCRNCGVVVCEHQAGPQYLNGGCLCLPCDRHRDSEAEVSARLRRLGVRP